MQSWSFSARMRYSSTSIHKRYFLGFMNFFHSFSSFAVVPPLPPGRANSSLRPRPNQFDLSQANGCAPKSHRRETRSHLAQFHQRFAIFCRKTILNEKNLLLCRNSGRTALLPARAIWLVKQLYATLVHTKGMSDSEVSGEDARHFRRENECCRLN